jgi:predicted SnoaL-like aldol condensation-catalyzing enzyme
MAERNVAVVRRAVERIWNGGDLAAADSLFAPAYVNHGGLIPDLVCGPEAIKISVALYRTAFPGLSIAIDSLVADGDSVELRWTAHGTSRDLPLSAGLGSQSETLSGTTRSRLSDGQIVESWTTWDRQGVLRRLANGEHGDHRLDG